MRPPRAAQKKVPVVNVKISFLQSCQRQPPLESRCVPSVLPGGPTSASAIISDQTNQHHDQPKEYDPAQHVNDDAALAESP